MLRLLAIAWLLIAVASSVRAEETIDSYANYVLDCMGQAKYLETEGFSRVAFTTFRYCRNQWLAIHRWSPNWEPAKFTTNLNEIDLHLAKIESDLKGQPPPPAFDQTFLEFLNISLASSKALDISRRRLDMLEKFQKEHPQWEPQLIARMLSDTKRDIASAGGNG